LKREIERDFATRIKCPCPPFSKGGIYGIYFIQKVKIWLGSWDFLIFLSSVFLAPVHVDRNDQMVYVKIVISTVRRNLKDSSHSFGMTLLSVTTQSLRGSDTVKKDKI
jgi:hypothetical protein